MVMSTGTIRPSLACAWVAALNSLQKPMMLTPCWPSAGPTGGEGFALPAGNCSLTSPVTFFAICVLLQCSAPSALRPSPATPVPPRGPSGRGTAYHEPLRLLHLHE